MKIIADLHLHGKFSQGTSKNADLQSIEKWAKIKGINLLGTGDFTHPKWIKEIKNNLTEDRTGILTSKTGQKFMLTTEISFVYTQDGKGRRVHLIILAPNLAVVDQITEYFLSKGRIDYDGRPIFKIPCDQLVEDMRKISTDIEVIPAHIWTPWFSMFGDKSGFDTIQDCFKDQTQHIHAIETGMSSNPLDNRRLKQLDNINLVSFSDSHSFWPWRLGREATMFDCDMKYKEIIKSIRTGEKLTGTVEVDPGYGKYHFSGHRKCNVVTSPVETKKLDEICPVCKKQLVIGVADRVEELADRPVDYRPKDMKPFYTLIPLSEVISTYYNTTPATKRVWEIYNNLIKNFGSEYEILLNTKPEELAKHLDKKLVDAMMLNREGKIKVKPGYDGVYGVPQFDIKEKQKTLSDF